MSPREPGPPSWQVHQFDHEQLLETALWIRAAGGLDVPAGGPVPGPVDPLPFPSPAVERLDDPDAAAGWRAWWEILLAVPGTGSRNRLELHPPDFAVLDPWPGLQGLAVRRHREALDWSGARKRPEAVERRWRRSGPLTIEVVNEAAARAGRRPAPFRLDLLVIPVLEDEVRRVDDTRYVVPERVLDGPDWPARLAALVEPLV